MPTTQPAAQRIDQRYPRRGAPRALVIAVVVALALVGLGWTVWIGVSRAEPAITGQVTGFKTAEDRVDINLVVQRPDPSRAGRCFVTAQATNYEQVGELWIEVPPSTLDRIDIQVPIRTFRRATTATLDHCVLA